jgi:DNA polymerase-1
MTENRLLLVDGHAVAFHCWYSEYPHSVISGFEQMLDEAIERNNASHLIVAFDPAPPTFRHDMWPQYKAGRPPVPARFLKECEAVKKNLDDTETIHITVKNYEADDVIGSLARLSEAQGFNTTIFTVDMDLLQLVTKKTNVEAFSQYHGMRYFDEDTVIDRFNGLMPVNIPDYKALVGDPSDNLPGVPGIGKLSANRIFECYSNLEEVYENIADIRDAGYRGAKNISHLLIENKSQAFLMRDLTTIVRDLPIDVEIRRSRIMTSIG